MSSRKEVSTSVEVEPDAISKVGFLISTVIEGVILMFKHTLLGATLGIAIATGMSAQANPDSVEEVTPVVQEELGWRDKISGVFSSAKDKAASVKEGALTLVNRDEKLKLYRERIEQLEVENARLEANQYSHQIEVGVEHAEMVSCAQEVHDYLSGLLETKGGSK